jgi:hypothetical protein
MKRLLIVIATLGISTAGAAYKCTDAKGVTHIGDTPPPGCDGVVMYEVSKSGRVMRTIEPTPTPEQLKAKLQEAERKKETDRIAAEQKRKDSALLSTFSSEKEFDVARDRNIEPIKVRISVMQERIAAVEKRQKEIEDEMEFYKAGKSKGTKAREMPPSLSADLERSRAEKSALVGTIVSHEKEIEQIKVKFDADKKRWVALRGGSQPAEAPAADAKSVKAPAADPKSVKKN